MSKKTNENIKAALAPTTKPKIAGLAIQLERQRGEITKALPKGMDVERFTRIALTTVRLSPDLTEIAQNNPLSIIAGCMLSAQLGLELGPLGQAYLVPFNSKNGPREAQFIIGYKGILKLARNSGDIASIEARAVQPTDYFDCDLGIDRKLVHRPDWEANRSEPASMFYGIARFTNGGVYPLPVTPAEIAEHRERSKAKDRGPWVTDRRAMELKTVIRMMAPWLPLSPESERGILADGAVSVDLSPNMAEDAASANADFIDLDSEEVPEPAVSEQPAEEDPGRPFEGEGS